MPPSPSRPPRRACCAASPSTSKKRTSSSRRSAARSSRPRTPRRAPRRSPRSAPRSGKGSSEAMSVDPRTPCVIGVAQRTWRPLNPDPADAPEPLDMWEEVVHAAAEDAGNPDIGVDADSLQIVYCQTWPYDDPVGRLAERLGAAPRHRYYSGIGGTTPQVLVNGTAESILRGEYDLAVITGAEALDTMRRAK